MVMWTRLRQSSGDSSHVNPTVVTYHRSTMTPAARITSALLLGVILVSLGYLVQSHSSGAEAYLFNGEMLEPRVADQRREPPRPRDRPPRTAFQGDGAPWRKTYRTSVYP